MTTELVFTDTATALDQATAVVVLGRSDRLLTDAVRECLPEAAHAVWQSMVSSIKPGLAGDGATSWIPGETLRQIAAGVLPEACSRHNSPARPHAVAALVAKLTPATGPVAVICALDEAQHAYAAGCSIARAFPVYTRKESSSEGREIRVAFVPAATKGDLVRLRNAAAGIRLAGRLVDMPASELHTDAFVDEARRVAENVGCELTLIRGEALRERGLGGLWGVGKAAEHPPALAVLSHLPAHATRTIAWVGKGIVFDTGGLCIKPREGMCSMKGDMGGAAAVLAAFEAAVRQGFPDRLHAILCLAENAVGPAATRPDDILTLYSGKTIEINNTDAEGRLVLGDGVAYAVKDLGADMVVDLATLTGAQLISTGKLHAACVSNDERLEQASVEAGKASGDLVHPLPYCPEFYKAEFESKVADLKNSVKDRMNAQSSCAAQFIAENLGKDDVRWLHLDIAGPAENKERGTGYGVALLLTLFGLGASPKDLTV